MDDLMQKLHVRTSGRDAESEIGIVRISSYRDLDAWKAAMDLVVTVYSVAERLPATERFELAKQMRRAAVSVPSNVAEGQANGPGKRYLNHVRMALGSVAELETQLELAVRLAFVSSSAVTTLERQLVRTGQLLHGLARSLRRQIAGKRTATSGER